MLSTDFFDQDAVALAKQLLGKIIHVVQNNIVLCTQIIETEAYYLQDKASHASLGYTEKRKALFMPPGTIYMYYSRAGDSLNISCQGQGNAVLIKSAFPYLQVDHVDSMLREMKRLNPLRNRERPIEGLCSGQVLLCRSLGLKVKDWDQKQFNNDFFIEDKGIRPRKIIQTTRLGIAAHRDADLPYRFIDYDMVRFASNNPLTAKNKPVLLC